jgi:hypothetical protein
VSGVVPSTPSPAGLYLRIHFTHQIQKSLLIRQETVLKEKVKTKKTDSWGFGVLVEISLITDN